MVIGEYVIVSGVVVFLFVSLLIFYADCQVLNKEHELLLLHNYIAYDACVVLCKTRALAPSSIRFEL